MAPQPSIIKLTKYVPVIEGICLAAFIVGYIMKIQGFSGNEVVIISLSILSGIYFIGAYTPPPPREADEENTQKGFGALLGETIVPKILGIGMSVSVIGILFMLQKWNGFREMLLIGSTALAGATVVGLVTTLNNEKARRALGPLFLRAIPLMLVGIYLLKAYGIAPPVN